MTEGFPACSLFFILEQGLSAADFFESKAIELMGSPFAQCMHARMLEWSGRLDEAENHYKEALDLEPNNGFCHLALGQLLERKGRVEEAGIYTKRAEILLGPENYRAWRDLAEGIKKRDEDPTVSGRVENDAPS